MQLTKNSILEVDAHARFRRFEDEAVVINQTSAEVLIVNEVATALLELLDGARTIAQCADVLEERFEVSRERLEKDLIEFSSELVSAGVAREVARQAS